MSRSLLIVGLGLLVIAGCAGVRREPTLYERLGGSRAIDVIVDDFVGRVTTDTRINGFSRGPIFRWSESSSRSSSARSPAAPARTSART